jgi:diaminopimelate decarboxylase
MKKNFTKLKRIFPKLSEFYESCQFFISSTTLLLFRLLLRLRFDPKTTNKIGFGEKFGCMPGENSEFLLRKAKELNLNVKGVAFHIGVGCLEYEIFAKAIKDSAAAFKYGNSLGLKMDLLDIGGGFPGAEIKTIVTYAFQLLSFEFYFLKTVSDRSRKGYQREFGKIFS